MSNQDKLFLWSFNNLTILFDYSCCFSRLFLADVSINQICEVTNLICFSCGLFSSMCESWLRPWCVFILRQTPKVPRILSWMLWRSPCQMSLSRLVNWCDHFTLHHCTTLHCTAPHHTTLHYTTLHAPHHASPHYTILDHTITSHCTTLHVLQYIHYTTPLHDTTPHYMHHTTLHAPHYACTAPPHQPPNTSQPNHRLHSRHTHLQTHSLSCISGHQRCHSRHYSRWRRKVQRRPGTL